MNKPVLTLEELLYAKKPLHWPTSSYYCVRSALRAVSKSMPSNKSFFVSELPSLLDQHLWAGPDTQKDPFSLLTYRSRILRFAAELTCGGPLQPWEAKRFFEKINLRNKNKKEAHNGVTSDKKT